MRKLLRYLINTILFIVFWSIMFLPVAKFYFDTGSTSIAIVSLGGIVALIISFALVKRINKSNLWSRLFDETNGIKSDKVYYIILALLVLSIGGYGINEYLNRGEFNSSLNETDISKNSRERIDLQDARNRIDLLTQDNLHSARAYTVRAYTILNDNSFSDGNIAGDVYKYQLNKFLDEIGKAIILEPSNFHLYHSRADCLRNLGSIDYLGYNNSEKELFLKKALIDLDIAISLFPQGTTYHDFQKGCNGDSNCELASIYIARSFINKQLKQEYCKDMRKACKLESTICSCCEGDRQEDENCF